MSEACFFVDCHSTTSLPTHSILVLDIHDLLAEIALVHVKVNAIQRGQLWQENVVSLLFWVCKVVSKYKTTLLRCMSVKVYIYEQISVGLMIMDDSLLCGPNRRLIKLKALKSVKINTLFGFV